jgi:hypothetical protein
MLMHPNEHIQVTYRQDLETGFQLASEGSVQVQGINRFLLEQGALATAAYV